MVSRVHADGRPLLDNEEIAVSLTDPYLLGLEGKPEKSLRGLEQPLRDQAVDVLASSSSLRGRLSSGGW